MYNKSLIIGKFYPLHKGHQFLIETALSQSHELYVIVCGKTDQTISEHLRGEWIKTLYPNINVIVIKEDVLDDDDTLGWAKLTLELLGFVPDAVFTSEEYGPGYAQTMGCKHVSVDPLRAHVPISATKIRDNPSQYMEFLDPLVRKHFVKRVCVVGAESTGTTTMSKALAEHYQTSWAPEYGRGYAEGKVFLTNYGTWSSDEFVHISKSQSESEDKLVLSANKVFISDTNALATSIWHERYMGFALPELETLYKDRKYDLYLVTDIDIPFVQDGTRDGEHIREWMHKKFIDLLKKRGENFVIPSGSHSARLAKAISFVDGLLKD